jgi:hypothetical protein
MPLLCLPMGFPRLRLLLLGAAWSADTRPRSDGSLGPARPAFCRVRSAWLLRLPVFRRHILSLPQERANKQG